MSEYTDWQTFSNNLIRYSKPELWLDLSLMDLPEDLVKTKKKFIDFKLLDQQIKLNKSDIEDGDKIEIIYKDNPRTP